PSGTSGFCGDRRGFGPQHTDFAPQRQHFREPHRVLPDAALMAANDPISPFWMAARHADRRPFFMARAPITTTLQKWYEGKGLSEGETAILQVSPGNETHLHAPRTELAHADGGRIARYLRTSPEFACKKLLAAGETKIFEFARVFRDR